MVAACWSASCDCPLWSPVLIKDRRLRSMSSVRAATYVRRRGRRLVKSLRAEPRRRNDANVPMPLLLIAGSSRRLFVCINFPQKATARGPDRRRRSSKQCAASECAAAWSYSARAVLSRDRVLANSSRKEPSMPTTSGVAGRLTQQRARDVNRSIAGARPSCAALPRGVSGRRRTKATPNNSHKAGRHMPSIALHSALLSHCDYSCASRGLSLERLGRRDHPPLARWRGRWAVAVELVVSLVANRHTQLRSRSDRHVDPPRARKECRLRWGVTGLVRRSTWGGPARGLGAGASCVLCLSRDRLDAHAFQLLRWSNVSLSSPWQYPY